MHALLACAEAYGFPSTKPNSESSLPVCRFCRPRHTEHAPLKRGVGTSCSLAISAREFGDDAEDAARA